MLNIQLRELINELSVHPEGPLHKVSSTKLVSVIKQIMCFAVWSLDMIWPNKIVVTISLSELSRWAKFVARKCLVLRNGEFLSIIFVNILSLNYKFRFDKFYWNFYRNGDVQQQFYTHEIFSSVPWIFSLPGKCVRTSRCLLFVLQGSSLLQQTLSG